MEFKNLLNSDEERAVSPVIGVILMVAITVILAAVIGTFVLGLGDQVQETSPNTQWSTSVDDNSGGGDVDVDVTFSHESGDSVNTDNLRFALNVDENPGGEELSLVDGTMTVDQTLRAGDSETAEVESSANVNDENFSGTVRLVWESDGGGQSSTLKSADFEGNTGT